jgi:hypothetical protein
VGSAKTAKLLVIMLFHGLFMNQRNIRVWHASGHQLPLRVKAKETLGYWLESGG